MRILGILLALFLWSGTAQAQEADIFNFFQPQVHTSTHHKGKRIRGDVRYLPHPLGCPRRLFCGCGAAVNIFGRPVRSLWLARAWFKFPRSAPGHNKVAVRRGHVFVLKQHVEGSRWYVYDANSGGRRTRYHIRSITGYTIVDPLSS